MNKIDFIDKNSGIKYNIEHIESFCMKVLATIGAENWEFSVMFSDDSYIAELNSEFRHKDGPTDVLTFCESESDWQFNNEDEQYYAGDMIISVDSMINNSVEFGVP